MIGALLSRATKAITVVLAVIVINFVLVRMAPGDPVSVLAGEAGASDAVFVEQLRREFQLDKPLIVQLGTYIGRVVQLDLGYSYRQNRPVADLILERLPATLLLTATAFALSLFVGGILGILAGLRRGSWADSLITTASLALYATPIFWIGLMLVMLFSVTLEWLPAFGMETLGARHTGWERVGDVAKHMVLPVITLGSFYVALYARMMRSSIADVQTSDFVKTARAKGLAPRRIVGVHMLRNAVLPVITLAGIQAGQLVGGSVLVETVFAWPGIGRLAFDALLQRDYMILLGVFAFTSILVVVFNIVTDLLYAIVDPRIRGTRS